MIAFKQHYLTEVANLAAAELYKYDWRVDMFLDKYKNAQPLQLVAGGQVILKYDKTIAAAVKAKDNPNKIVFRAATGNTTYTLKDFAKSKEFGGGGGKGAGADVTRTTESAQAVYAAARWAGSKNYTAIDLERAYKGCKVDEPLEGILNGLSPAWRDSCILGAEALHKKYGKKNYTFHRGSDWVDSLETVFKKLNSAEKVFSNVNKWSPADIYMVSPAGAAVKLLAATNIIELNGLLLEALRNGDIVGVSLKLLKGGVKLSTYNAGDKKHTIEFDRFTTGTKGFFGGKDIYMYFSHDGKIQFRTFPETFQGEIKGRNANQGKLSYGPIQTVLRHLKLPQLIDIKTLRKALAESDRKVYAEFYKNYTRYAMDTSKLSLDSFIEECKSKGDSWVFSKYLGCQLIDIVKTSGREDDFITSCIQYASSSSDLSAPFIKLE
jgi:hypothetical protein